MPDGRETGYRLRTGACLLASASVTCLLACAGCDAARGAFGGRVAAPVPAAFAAHDEIPVAVRIFFRPLPARAPGGGDDTPEMVDLGYRLFFERGLSLSRSQSCNDCHRLDEPDGAGVDHLATAKGAQGVVGKRNTPMVLNAAFEVAQFWDGRAADLVEQAKGPLLNPSEMAMRSEADVVARLQGDRGWRDRFERAYPGEKQPITFHNVARAIAAFERTLVTPSRFDRYLRGETAALTEKERAGLMRFVETGCIECHSSHAVGGRLFRKFGVYHPYPNGADLGRHAVTRREEDRCVFKVCSLRNVTLTAPYFHDGRVSALPEAVRLMAKLQLDSAVSPAHVDEIVRFLRTLEAEAPAALAQPAR